MDDTQVPSLSAGVSGAPQTPLPPAGPPPRHGYSDGTNNVQTASPHPSLDALINARPRTAPSTPCPGSTSAPHLWPIGSLDARTNTSNNTSEGHSAVGSGERGGRIRRASDAFSDHLSEDETRNPPTAKYQRLAAVPGLSGPQVMEAASMAHLTPRTVRVVMHARVLALENLVNKLEAAAVHTAMEAQESTSSKHWDIPSKYMDRIRKFARMALLTPMPHQWKSGRTPVIYKLLQDNKKLPKDVEKHQNRLDAMNSEIGEALSRARSKIKSKILSTIGLSSDKAVNIHALCTQLLEDLGIKNQILITKDVLAGIAYLRGLMEFEMGNQAVGREAWDILDVRLRSALEGRLEVPLRMEYLQDWLARDEQVHGAVPGTVVIKAKMGELQQKIANAMQAIDYTDEAPVP